MDYFHRATSPLSSARSQKSTHGLLTGSGNDLTEYLTGNLTGSGKDLTGDLTESQRPRSTPRLVHSRRSFATTSTASSSSAWLDENNKSSYFLRSFDSHVSSEAGN